MRPFAEDVFQVILDAAPSVISFALGQSPEIIKRAHDAGALFVQQVHSVEQALRAAEEGADVIIAQGDEAGGFGGAPGTIVIVPQVAEAVHPIPVVAAGGIGDGRGLAAALALGAAGVNVGTRFLASVEAEIDEEWKQAILAADSPATTRASFVNQLLPPPSPGAFDVAPRVLRTPFIERWLGRDEQVAGQREGLVEELTAAVQEGRAHELLPITGEVAGMVKQILPAGEIIRQMVADAEALIGDMAALTR
jgi:enoyl-[acyl-carrier protein] reductase II